MEEWFGVGSIQIENEQSDGFHVLAKVSLVGELAVDGDFLRELGGVVSHFGQW